MTVDSFPDTSRVLADAQQFLMPTYAPLPMVPARGSGATLWDADGRDYIDLGSGIAVTSLGHNPPSVRAAIDAQLDRVWHLSNVFTNEPATVLAAKLVEHTFAERVFFSNSGAEANEAALKLARRFAHDSGRPEAIDIVALDGSFHGRTLFTVSVGGNPSYREGFGPDLPGIRHIAPDDLDQLREAVSTTTCAVILEPIQGEGGVRPLSPEYLAEARRLCDETGTVLIFDEVQTGAGRTGTLYAYQGLDITPDVLTSAKGIGGGVPIGITLAAGPCATALGRATHGTTFGGNPVACAAAGAVLDALVGPEVPGNVEARHHQIIDSLSDLDPEHQVFAEIRGAGLLLGIELVPELAGRAKELQLLAVEEGVIPLVAGADVLRLAPALTITEEETTTGLARLARAVEKLAAT
jgi:acetylornithine/N-succinyldiaminopimelate aminotransferase